MIHDKPVKIIIGTMVLALLAGAIGVSYIMYQQGTATPATNQTQKPITPATSSFEWVTFSSPDYPFSFQYPKGWIINEQALGVQVSTGIVDNREYTINIGKAENPRNLTAKQWIEDSISQNKVISDRGEAPALQYQGVNYFTVAGDDKAGYGMQGVFSYDSNRDSVAYAHGNGMYTFDFPSKEENENFVDPVKNYEVALKIMETFHATGTAITPTTKTYADDVNKVVFTYPSNAEVLKSTMSNNDVLIKRDNDIHIQINYYPSAVAYDNYPSLDALFKDRESGKVMANRSKITFNGMPAWQYQENGATTAYTILVPHEQGSFHIISYMWRETAGQRTPAEIAVTNSIHFTK